MERTYLVQRLLPPDKAVPIAFGGMSKENGCMSDESMALIKDIFAFDYMGAAEFEFGAVPEALEKLFEQKKLVAGSVKLDYRYKDFRTDIIAEGNKRVFYLCRKEEEKEVKTRLATWAKTDFNKMKEYLGLNMALAGVDRWDVGGWLELSNGFMFFTDEKMWRASCKLFEVATPSKKKVSKE